MSPVRCPSPASASARFVATVDLPTPPLPLATARMLRIPVTACGPPPAAASRRRQRRPLADDRQALGAGYARERRPDRGLDLPDGLLVGGARGQRHRDPARRDLDVSHQAEGDDVPGEARVRNQSEALQELLRAGHALRLPTTRVGRKAGRSSVHSCQERTRLSYLLYTIWRLWSLS